MVIELVQLTSGSHHANILTALHQLRLQGQLSDVTVQIDHRGDTQEFQAHQVMLAASSGYFRQILLSPDAARDKLLLSNMNASDFSKFLEFVYTGKVEVARDSIGDLQALAQLLVCDDLAQVCSEALSAGIVPKLPNQTAGSESVGGGGLHDVKKESKAKEKRRLQISPTRRELSPPQDAEPEAVAKRTRGSDASDKRQGRRTKLRLAARKVLPRRLHAKKEAPVNDEEAPGDDAVEHEDTAEAEAQPENEEGSPPGKLAWVVDDLGGENECQGDDPEELPSTLEGEKGEQDQEEQGDGEEEQPKETKKISKAQFQCNKCQRTFRYERSFLKHISMYHGVKADVVYRCETCSQTFANRSNLKIHEKHVHSSEREFSCSFCLKTFKRKKDVVRHQRQVHERNLQQVCPVCGKALSSKTALLLHERTHTGLKPYECPDCLARFTQNSALKMHRRTHTGEKPYACDECDARFTQKHMLSYHKRSHSGERPFMCEACGKSFASKEYLRHHSNIHTGSKPYKCERCGRGFAQRNSLIQHLKIHTGERPYSCKECDKQFTQLNALQRHQRIHTGEKPYMCSLCKRTFTDMSTLRRHTMIHDSDAPWKTYLVVLEGNMEEKKDKSLGKGKSEKAGHAEKKSAGKKAAGAVADTPSKPDTPSIQVPAEQVALPTDWASHGAITLVSHGTLGGITVIHTEVHPGTQLQPIVTTDGTGASVISLDGSSIPFSIPVSLAHPVSVSSEVPSTSLSAPVVSVPVSTSMLTPDSGIPTVSTSSVLETAASQTILAPASESDDTLSPDIETVIVGDSVSCKVQKQTGDECEAGPAEQHDANPPAV